MVDILATFFEFIVELVWLNRDEGRVSAFEEPGSRRRHNLWRILVLILVILSCALIVGAYRW